MASVVRRVLYLNTSGVFLSNRRYPVTHRRPALSRDNPMTTFVQRSAHRCFAIESTSEQREEGVVSQEEIPSPSALDIRVGKVLSCERHPDADALFVEQIDVGEDEPRTICSGLVPYLTAEDLSNTSVVVLCNLKARNLRGIKSHGMLLCASDKENGKVAPLLPPSDAVIGERIRIGPNEAPSESENRIKKQKIWEKLQPLMQTDDEGVATCDGQPMTVSNGAITCRALPRSPIS